MSALSPDITLNKSFGEMLAWTTRQLNSTGLRIEQTFDLQVARLSHVGYLCPTHGTNPCDCQMIVLLVYGVGSEPLTLILYGNDDQNHITTIMPPDKRSDKKLDTAIRQALTLGNIYTV
jgi:hypothetical protein